MFITKSDLLAKIRASDLEQITDGQDIIVEHALIYSVGIIRSYICERYDAEKIFAAQGELREGMLVSIAADIAIYEIIAQARPNIDMTDRRERRNQALAYLQAVSDGVRPTGWPLLAQQDDDTQGCVEHGGRAARDSYY